nr:hypothetical protein Iba_chr03bCG17120 [Ipomoea batatas]GMC78001.1 hypothetical protein Iba_chr03fCG3840 [Ipomoea batatas]
MFGEFLAPNGEIGMLLLCFPFYGFGMGTLAHSSEMWVKTVRMGMAVFVLMVLNGEVLFLAFQMSFWVSDLSFVAHSFMK